MVKPMKSPYESPYKKYDPEAFKRRMERQRKKMNASSVTADESKDQHGNSRLSSIRRG